MQHLTFHSALTATGILASGCLVPPPIDIEEPERVSPRAFTHKAVPLVDNPWATSSAQVNASTLDFLVPFASEDFGEPVVGRLFLNFGAGDEQLVGSSTSPASTLDDTNRSMSVAWKNPTRTFPGCYLLTMTIAHAENYSGEHPNLPEDWDKTAFVYWWVAHDLSFDQLSLLDCDNQGDHN